MIRRPPRPPLFPYTTLSRSGGSAAAWIIAAPTRATTPVTRHGDRGACSGASIPPRRSARVSRPPPFPSCRDGRSEEHTSELQSQSNLVCRLLLEKKNKSVIDIDPHTPDFLQTLRRSARSPSLLHRASGRHLEYRLGLVPPC